MTGIGGKCYINNLGDKPPSTKRPRFSNEAQKKKMISRLGYKNQMIIGMTEKYKFIGII